MERSSSTVILDASRGLFRFWRVCNIPGIKIEEDKEIAKETGLGWVKFSQYTAYIFLAEMHCI